MPKKKKELAPITAPSSADDVTEELVPESEELALTMEQLKALPSSVVTDLYDEAVQVIKDALSGKKEFTPSRLALAKFIVTQTEGKAGTKEVEVKASNVILHICLPGK